MEPSDKTKKSSGTRDPSRKPAKAKDSPGDQTLVFRRRAHASPTLAKLHPGLVVIQGREIGREYRLRRSELILGRDEGVHVRIPDEGVSRKHALIELSWDADRRVQHALIRDLGSTNGTLVNGERVASSDLREGDKIRLGDTVLKFVLQDDLDARFHQEVHNRIAYDQLTGLLTKEFLYVAMETELKRCEKFGQPMAVLMMDLDRFKLVNDGYGHLMGSHVLSEVGWLIREGFRSTDVSARYGGEEFLAYMSEVTLEGGVQAAERIRSAVEEHPFTRTGETGRSTTVRVTISLGVSEFPRHGASLESLVAAADAALYRAKESGRNRVCAA
ncbi:MAG: GGDEF domain-containing protein [Acidobacteria bacterium]|nr:GGDEF domain-containing protein [Acidobacteriota bacterium]